MKTAYATCFSQFVQRKTINLEVSLEALPVHPRRQAAVLVLCNTQTTSFSSSSSAVRAQRVGNARQRSRLMAALSKHHGLARASSPGCEERGADTGQINNDQTSFREKGAAARIILGAYLSGAKLRVRERRLEINADINKHKLQVQRRDGMDR